VPIERLFTESDVQRLLDMNAAPPFGHRNAALIISAVYWGLAPSELSLIRLEDVVDQSGEFYRIWTLPGHAAYTGEPRELRTEDHILPFLNAYMDWRIEKKACLSNRSWYRGSDPKSPFFLNDRLGSFSLSPRAKGGSDYQPRAMNEKLRSFIEKAGIEGATPRTFRDSCIKAMYDAGCHYKDLMLITGIKQKETIDRKVRPREQELQKVFQEVFGRVRVPI
jgi:integrase